MTTTLPAGTVQLTYRDLTPDNAPDAYHSYEVIGLVNRKKADDALGLGNKAVTLEAPGQPSVNLWWTGSAFGYNTAPNARFDVFAGNLAALPSTQFRPGALHIYNAAHEASGLGSFTLLSDIGAAQ